MDIASEFVYRIPGKPGGSRPGAHSSSARGPGLAFSNYLRLIDQPDPRRLDLRASLRNVHGDWLVRATRQNSSTVVQLIMDVSLSMQFGTPHTKLDVAAQFVEGLGHSAFGYGDALGMVAFDSEPRLDLTVPARTGRGVGSTIAHTLRQLRTHQTTTGDAQTMHPQSLSTTAMSLRHGSSLVFLVSDFHWSLDYLEDALDQLSHATVVPIVIWSRNEIQPPPAGRWLRARDLESGKVNNLIMRASTIRLWHENITQRRAAIRDVFEAHGMTPFFMEEGFVAEELSRYFMETAL